MVLKRIYMGLATRDIAAARNRLRESAYGWGAAAADAGGRMGVAMGLSGLEGRPPGGPEAGWRRRCGRSGGDKGVWQNCQAEMGSAVRLTAGLRANGDGWVYGGTATSYAIWSYKRGWDGGGESATVSALLPRKQAAGVPARAVGLRTLPRPGSPAPGSPDRRNRGMTGIECPRHA